MSVKNMVDENQQPKLTTVSVRIEEELLKQLDSVSSVLGVIKSDFLRACIKKLCEDNRPLLDHCSKVPEYVEYIKTEISKLPAEMVEVKNGSWQDVNDAVAVLICNALWRWSEPVYKNWVDFSKYYGFRRTDSLERSEGLLDIASIAMITANKIGTMQNLVIEHTITRRTWVDEVEMDKVSLLYSCKKAIEETSVQKVFESYIEKESSLAGERMKMVIDAKGTLRRSGSMLYTPVESEALKQR
jgi:hypothetical protein